jgi:hypothetical protein
MTVVPSVDVVDALHEQVPFHDRTAKVSAAL